VFALAFAPSRARATATKTKTTTNIARENHPHRFARFFHAHFLCFFF